MENNNFEIEVKVALIKKHMTQSMLAKELGIANSYLSDILKGHRKAQKYRAIIKDKLQIGSVN